MEAHSRPSRAPAYRRDAPFAAAALTVLSATMFLAACDSAETTGGPGSPVSPAPIVSIDPPAAQGAIAPDLSPAGAGLILTWVEPAAPAGHAVRMSRLSRDDGTWSWGSPTTVAVGEDFFVNWADFPSVREATDGSMIAHWLARSGPGAYAYDVQLARSIDRGATWRRLGPAHDDGTKTEHGFVSMVPGPRDVMAFWLDGREMGSGEVHHDAGDHAAGGGAMTLRAAPVGETVGASEVLDARVCECCQTAAAPARDGPVVVYRNRSDTEIRDIWIVRRDAGGWSDPQPVHEDGWAVPGCPVNGPAIDSDGSSTIWTAWFTAEGNRPRVLASVSVDGGRSFSEPILIDAGQPIGRVDTVMVDGDAVASWVSGVEGDAAEIRLRRLSPAGAAGDPLTVAGTLRTRGSGFPRIGRLGDSVVVAWADAEAPARIRAAAVPLSRIPSPLPKADRAVTSGPARPWDASPGSLAPDYAATPLAGGPPMTLASLRGAPVLMNVWATWCAPCRQETPHLSALHERYSGRGLRLLGVSVDEAGSEERVRRAVAEESIPYTILLDPDDRASSVFRLPMLPGSFLFDAEGRLVWSRQGVIGADEPELIGAIEKTLAGD